MEWQKQSVSAKVFPVCNPMTQLLLPGELEPWPAGLISQVPPSSKAGLSWGSAVFQKLRAGLNTGPSREIMTEFSVTHFGRLVLRQYRQA